MVDQYNPDWVRNYYDRYGVQEWQRWDTSPVQSVKFEIHRHYLNRFVSQCDHVLEIGAGAGRFTREIADIARAVTVADISPVQLELNRKHSQEYGYADSVLSFRELDVLDMQSHFAPERFDAVVCYGGLLSYTLDRRAEAVRRLSYVTRTGGHILASVMCLFGTMHQFLPRTLALDPRLNERIVRTGDITEEERDASLHRHHLFRSHEVRELLEGAGLRVVAMAASNSVSAAWDAELEEVRTDEQRWKHLIQLEIEATAQQGCADMGTHIIAVARKE